MLSNRGGLDEDQGCIDLLERQVECILLQLRELGDGDGDGCGVVLG